MGRTSYDAEEVEKNVVAVFRDFEAEYLRPDYLLNRFWQFVERTPRGYFHLIAPGGLGKTYFVRGLVREGRAHYAPVLPYFILSGALTDYRTFISELADRWREALPRRTQEVQTGRLNQTELQD